MLYKLYVYCPTDDVLIQNIIHAAAERGAGTYGSYSHVAFVTEGNGYWRSGTGAKPVHGRVGTDTKAGVVRIEMICDAKDSAGIAEAIKAMHPWEQVDVEFVEVMKK